MEEVLMETFTGEKSAVSYLGHLDVKLKWVWFHIHFKYQNYQYYEHLVSIQRETKNATEMRLAYINSTYMNTRKTEFQTKESTIQDTD